MPESKEYNTQTRDSFKSKLGFIMSCIGSAVGMGNIWMFPYRVGELGGWAFLIPYIFFIIIIGFSGVVGEMAFGRAMGTGSLGAFKKVIKNKTGKNWGEIIGSIPVIGSFAIAVGYSVVVGWIMRFLFGTISGSILNTDLSDYFDAISGDFGSVPWHILGLTITFSIMIFGISNGIEKINKILMPLFFILFIGLAIRVFFIEGANEGYSYLTIPKWEYLARPKTWILALGQAFFSLSLAGSGTLIYGSYLKKSEDIISCARNVTIFDTLAALLSALVIIPATFAFNLESYYGPKLMFITMPEIFKQIYIGRIFGIVFFIAVLSAAITSLVNLFETPIEALQSKFGISRFKSVSIVIGLALILGIFIENAESVALWMDFLSIYVIPLGALLSGILFFWVCDTDFARSQVQMGRNKKVGAWFEPMTKYVFIGLTIAVYILGIFYGNIG